MTEEKIELFRRAQVRITDYNNRQLNSFPATSEKELEGVSETGRRRVRRDDKMDKREEY